jgi:hypothetical protein
MKKSEKYQERKRQKKARREAASRVVQPKNIVRIGEPSIRRHFDPNILCLAMMPLAVFHLSQERS